MSARPTLFFSFRSPFSWLLVERLRRHVADAHERIEFVPFWEPDPRMAAALAERDAGLHYVPMSKAKHLYILQDTKRLAGRLGLEMAWPIDVDPWWELSHCGWLQARRFGRTSAFYEAVVAARWQRGENICDPDVIGAAARSAGLDPEAIVAAAEDPEIRADGLECLVRAFEDDIFGVPYLRLGWQRFWGFDRLDDFLRAFGDGARAERPAEVPDSVASLVGAYDTDTAGGCG